MTTMNLGAARCSIEIRTGSLHTQIKEGIPEKLERSADGTRALMQTLMTQDELVCGIRLFKKLAALTLLGECVGISYQQFCCLLNDVETFLALKGRTWKPSGSAWAIGLSKAITHTAGRISVVSYGVTIQTGMDTYL